MTDSKPPSRPPSRRAVGQILIAVYAVFAVSAGARAGVQIATRFDEAPVAYLLSAFAAAVYLIATVAFRVSGRRAFLVALAACTIELLGVLTVGTMTLLDPDLFADQTVWSAYGQGYGFVPLLLPVLGLAWLSYVARTDPSGLSRRA
jgi:cytochrome bd-type quinol oxidase subunit 2